MAAEPDHSGQKPIPTNVLSSLPSFLDRDPFPSQLGGRPISSATSDATSEYEYVANRGSQDGPVSRQGAGLLPSRPTTAASSRIEAAQSESGQPLVNPPPSRRGLVGLGRRDGDVSRPGTAVSSSHVPSLMAQGFSRPMSPQTLQAQRGQAIMNSALFTQSTTTQAATRSSNNHRRRESDVSVHTDQGDFLYTNGEDVPPVPAKDAQLMSPGQVNPTGATARQKIEAEKGRSLSPLYLQQQSGPQQGGEAVHLDRSGSQINSKSNRSSVRASLGLNSRRSSKKDFHERRAGGHGHEKLPSNASSPALAAKEGRSTSSKDVQTTKSKNYEYYAGNVLFFCSGRCLNSRAHPLNITTFVLTVLPGLLFFGFSAPWLWHHVSPAIPIFFAYFFFITISSLLHAAFSDPGILPRNLHPHPPDAHEERDPLALGPPTTEWVMVKTNPSRRQPSALSATENGSAVAATAMEVPTKYCKSCHIWRPLRAHHCRTCDACMEAQDHHCAWLNNCVGRRNYRYFFAYVGFASLMALLLFAFSVTHIHHYATLHHISFGAALSGRTAERVAFAMMLYGLLALPYPASLLVYHLFLIARGETTREYLNSHKFPLKDRHRPFSQATWYRNWAVVLARPRPPTYMSFKRAHVPGDARYGHALPRRERRRRAKQDAIAAGERVEGFKARFSVPGTGKPDPPPKGNGVEMKQLSPRADNASPQRASAGRPVDSTPR